MSLEVIYENLYLSELIEATRFIEMYYSELIDYYQINP
jgi:hypothetical protein